MRRIHQTEPEARSGPRLHGDERSLAGVRDTAAGLLADLEAPRVLVGEQP